MNEICRSNNRYLSCFRPGLWSLLALAVLIFGVMTDQAQASHFRFGHITWTDRPDISATTVEFTVKHGWRRTACSGTASDGFVAVGDPTCSFTSATLLFGDGESATLTGTVVSIDTANNWFLATYTNVHTYSSSGPFTASFSSCCRISTLVNAADAGFKVSTVVDLRSGNTGSPVSSISPILQMGQGSVNTVSLPIADPDGDSSTCRMATSSESDIPSVATAGDKTLSVSSGCSLSWDTSGTSIGQLYAAQVIIDENHASNISGVALDFIIEIVGGTINQPPICTLNGSSSNVVPVGQTFTITMTGTDPDGDSLTINHLGLPSGATLSPPAGSTGPSPLTATFSWTPTSADAGTGQAVSVTFTDPGGLQALCSFSIQVPAQVPANQAPVLAPIGNKTVVEGQNLSFTISATDADGDTLTFSASNLPSGASFSGQTFSWTPNFTQAGTYTGVHFEVTDGTNTDSEDITITVNDAPAPLTPSLLLPVHGQAGLSLTPTFSWQPGQFTEFSRLQIATDLAFNQLVADIPQLTLGSHTLVNTLAHGTTYYWRVIASNPAGQTSSAIFGFITLESGGAEEQTSTFPMPAAKGAQDYRQISVPLFPDDPDAQAVLGDDLGPYVPTRWRLFRYDPSINQYREYPNIPGFAPGLAYWLITTQGGTLDVRGRPVDTTQDFAITLAPGWNQIGTPFKFPVDLANVKVRQGSTEVLLSDPANTWVDNTLWEFEATGVDQAGYQLKNQLIPWHGYWVHNRSSGAVKLIIPNKAVIQTGAATATAMAKQGKTNPWGWYLKIGATQGSFVDSYNFLGVAKGASLYWDTKDLSEPSPVSSDQVRLYFIHLEGQEDIHAYATDYQPPILAQGQYEFVVESGDTGSEIILSWSQPSLVPQSYEILLADLATGKLIDMREDTGYSFYPGAQGKRYFKIIVTNNTDVIDPSVQSSINQNIFNSGDTIHWDISLDGLGKVDAYLGIVFPSWDFISLLDLNGNTSGLNNPAPIVTDWSVVPGTFRLMSYTFTGDEPKGDYQLFVIFTKPGSDPLDNHNWLAYEISPFTVK